MRTFNENDPRYEEALKQVKKVKGFYIHFVWYLLINGFVILASSIRFDAYSGVNFTTNSLWFWWGIGIAFHWYGVFGKNLLFGKRWEEKRIKELMDKEK